MKNEQDVVIIGGGPAGMMAGLLFARAGLTVTVLEKHNDFLRDFRGDTVHPSTLELFHELGWLEELLELQHRKIGNFSVAFEGRRFDIADLSSLPVTAPFIAMMPQWDLLDFLARKASQYPGFTLKMNARVDSLVTENKRIVGVELSEGAIRSKLTLMCGGRGNELTKQSGLPGETFGVPMDVLWFRIPKSEGTMASTGLHVASGGLVVLIDRTGYWQAALVIGKGQAERMKAQGIEAIRAHIEKIAEPLRGHTSALKSTDDLKLLNVEIDRLSQWSRPGFLAIGDAAHAMSPIGGVGINLAVQDAVATANILFPAFRDGLDIDEAAKKVKRRRHFPAAATQRVQRIVQDQMIGKTLDATTSVRAPLPIRLAEKLPIIGKLGARFVGMGLRPEHIQTPEA